MVDKAQIVVEAVDRTREAFASVKRGLDGVNKSAGSLGRAMSLALPALSSVGFVAFAKSAIDSADALNDMSQRLGVSVKDLASFKLAAEQSGTSLDSIGTGIARLSKAIGEAEANNKKVAQALTDLGISARDPKEAFFQLADAVQGMEDPSKRAALLTQVLGKNYLDLVPLLSQGSQGLRDSALASASFAEQMAILAPNADRFNDELAKLKINTAGIGASILNDIVPPMGDWLVAVNKLIDRHGVWLGILSAIGAAAIPGVTAGDVAGDVSITAFKRELQSAKDELKTIEAATKSGTFGLIQRAIYGSEEDMRRKGDYLRSNIKTLEESIQQFQKRTASKPGAAGGIDNAAQLQCIASGGTWDGKKCVKKATGGGGSKADPLASLLGSTDIGKTREYDKLLGLLNVRFRNGAKDAELYKQAVEALNKQFGKTQIDVFGNGAFKTADSGVADFIRQQEEAVRQMTLGIDPAEIANLDDLLAGADFSKVLKDQEDMVFLARAFTDGIVQADGSLRKLSEAEYLDAVNARLGISVEKIEEMDVFAKRAAENIQDSFADFLFDPFENGMEGMADSFQKTVQRMVAEALAADLGKALFGDLVGGDGSGMLGDLLKGLFGGGSSGGSDQNILGSFASLFGFANGGIMTSAGPLPLRAYAGGGIASRPQLAMFGEGSMPEAFVPLPDGRRIPVDMRGHGGGGTTVININGVTDFDSFRRSEGQVAARVSGMLSRARRNM